MIDLKTYILETKKISPVDDYKISSTGDYVQEGFRLGKNKVDIKDYDFVDLGLPSKTLWCKHNIGATCEDDAKSWYGNYFMWGDTEPADNKICDWANYKYVVNGNYNKLTKYCINKNYWGGKGKYDNKSVLDEEDDIASVNMDEYWKMPTKEQLQELIDNTKAKFVHKYNGISKLNGILFTSEINGNELFFPAAGFRSGNFVYYIGSNVNVWSSTVESLADYAANYLDGDNVDWYISNNNRYLGFSVRGVTN